MSKFWAGAATLLVLGIAAIFMAAGASSKIHVNDLETECRGDRASKAVMQLKPDNSLRFKGYYHVDSTNANLKYDYSRNGNTITLNVKSQQVPKPQTFWNSCLASAVYDFRTQSLEPGTYSVEIEHNGERAEKKIIQVE